MLRSAIKSYFQPLVKWWTWALAAGVMIVFYATGSIENDAAARICIVTCASVSLTIFYLKIRR